MNLRHRYATGDLRAREKPDLIVPQLPGKGSRSTQRGHITRDIAFSTDGARLLVSLGSASNDAEGIGKRDRVRIARWEARHGLGAAWGSETNRAVVLAFNPHGKNARLFATGIRNCVGLAVQQATGDVWCSTNERDELGDDLVPDFITRVPEGAFYGWPWTTWDRMKIPCIGVNARI